MYDRLFSDLRVLRHAYHETVRGLVQEWVRKHAPRLELVRHDFVDDEVSRLILTLRLPVAFATQEGFLAWRSGVGWTKAASDWGVIHLLVSADTYEVTLGEGDKKPCLILLHFHDPPASRGTPS